MVFMTFRVRGNASCMRFWCHKSNPTFDLLLFKDTVHDGNQAWLYITYPLLDIKREEIENIQVKSNAS